MDTSSLAYSARRMFRAFVRHAVCPVYLALFFVCGCRGSSNTGTSQEAPAASIALPLDLSVSVPPILDASALVAATALPLRDAVPMIHISVQSMPRCRGVHVDDALCSAEAIHVKPFAIDSMEVTVGAYLRCVEAGGCKRVELRDGPPAARCNWHPERYGRKLDEQLRHPANCVTLEHARAYCQWTDKRLPTADEWEIAARTPDKRKYPWGDEIPSHLDIYPMGLGTRSSNKDLYRACWRTPGTCRVGMDTASPLGIHDMAGNVSEWTSDPACVAGKPCALLTKENRHLDYRIACGTDYADPPVDEPSMLYLAACEIRLPDDWDPRLGFRCARSLDEASR